MIFNEHSELKGKHAILSPSQPAWLNYTEEKFDKKYKSEFAQAIGTSSHSLAETLIKENIKLKKVDKNILLVHLLKDGIPRNVFNVDDMYVNFMTYVNDAIGFKMKPEQILRYSEYCFGTADTIVFRDNMLRIHDYKSGKIPADMRQLMIYDALFCLEYKKKPGEIEHELRIYQNNEVLVHKPTPDEILHVMDDIITSHNIIYKLRMEG